MNISRILSERNAITKQAVMLENQYGNGVTNVTDDFLRDDSHRKDGGIIVVKDDGLFTTLPDVLLLNKSGDAHAVILESSRAAGIFVGSWRCVCNGIFANMMAHFDAAGVKPHEITLRVGPGLGRFSYSVGEEVFKTFSAENPASLAALSLKNNGQPGKSGKIKYLFDFPAFMTIAAAGFGITSVNIDESVNTFDKRLAK